MSGKLARARLATTRPHWLPSNWIRWLLATVVLLGLLLVLFRRPLADRIWPEGSAPALRDRAALALARGHLTAADGSGARELYEAALAIDPDGSDARVGLMRVAQAALGQAAAAIGSGRYADAHRDLQLARSLSVPVAQADAVAARLRQEEARHAGIERLLAQAASARAAHRLDGSPDAALPLYQRILAMQPDRVEALEGREDALSDLLQQARRALEQHDLEQGARLVAAARAYDPGHADLPDAQARLSSELDQASQRAERDLRAGRLDRAGTQFQSVLRIDSANTAAQRGLEHVAIAWARRAERAASDFQFADADRALAQARLLAPDAVAVRNAGHAITRARQARATLKPSIGGRERARRVRQLLQQAAAAEKKGDLLTPPGDSAFDKLRAARALAPTDRAVRAESRHLLVIARQCFERELRNNNLGGAGSCLDARIALDGEGRRIGQDRRRLAQRWLAVGDERLTAGDRRGAVSALEHARALDAQTPGIAQFSERLRLAGAQ
jgi:tetratricopeptide (TPR) repeat protein